MEDERNIKKLLESQGDVHEKVTNQVRVQLGVQDHLVFKMTSRMHTTSILDVLHIQGKLRR
jgi:hypothetical protein